VAAAGAVPTMVEVVASEVDLMLLSDEQINGVRSNGSTPVRRKGRRAWLPDGLLASTMPCGATRAVADLA
jgi:hypothetical protein